MDRKKEKRKADKIDSLKTKLMHHKFVAFFWSIALQTKIADNFMAWQRY